MKEPKCSENRKIINLSICQPAISENNHCLIKPVREKRSFGIQTILGLGKRPRSLGITARLSLASSV
jgi:hypothetical protein